MNMVNRARSSGPRRTASAAAAIALCAALFASASARAIEIDTGNQDLQVHFDNTIRYNLGRRIEAQDPAILGNPNLDDGDRNFAKNSTVTNRLDLLSEFDIAYKENLGLRVSAASWYDHAYAGSLDNTSVATSNHLVNGEQALGLSDYTRRYYRGPSGEWLDAFVFGTLDIGSMPLNVRLGRHTVYWGESLLGAGAIHGMAYGQAPLDLGKAQSTPGIEIKELFRPRNQVSAQLQATPELSIAGQYFLDWEASRFPEAGSYYGSLDILLKGGESYLIAPGLFATQGTPITPKKSGDWGLAARWSPQWLDGTLGFYARRLSDNLPQLIVDLGSLQYFTNYADGIDLYGVSLSKQIAGISFGMDLNYRRNMPLASQAVVVMSQAELPGRGEILGARGNTAHAVFNALGVIKDTPVFDSASWIAELAWSRTLSVTSDPNNVYLGRAGYDDIDRVTHDYFGIGLSFTPTWFQALPGADLSLPLSYSRGISGTSAVAGAKNSGSYSVGLGLDLYSKYRFDLKFADFFGDYRKDASGAVENYNGSNAVLKDRGAIYFTFKTTL